MDIHKTIDQRKQFHNSILSCISSDNDVENKDEHYQKIWSERGQFGEALQLISNIANNYHRTATLIPKIEKILSHYSNQIKQTLSNSEIFHIFKSHECILLFLFKQNIISHDETVLQYIEKKSDNFDITSDSK